MKVLWSIVLFGLFSIHCQATEVQVSLLTQALALGQIVEKNIAGPEASGLIKAILTGQEYNERVSITATFCSVKSGSVITNCTVVIGVDDLFDGDSGWTKIYNLIYEIDENSKVTSAKLQLIAG